MRKLLECTVPVGRWAGRQQIPISSAIHLSNRRAAAAADRWNTFEPDHPATCERRGFNVRNRISFHGKSRIPPVRCRGQEGHDFRHGRLRGAVQGGGPGLRRLLGPPGPRARDLEAALHPVAGRIRRPFLQVVRRRQAERFLQLPRPQYRSRPRRQGRHHFRSRRRPGHQGHLQGTAGPGSRPSPTRSRRRASRRATAS
jgi:hypothetical protein